MKPDIYIYICNSINCGPETISCNCSIIVTVTVLRVLPALSVHIKCCDVVRESRVYFDNE